MASTRRQASPGDSAQKKYTSSSDYWTHPSRLASGRAVEIGSQTVFTDKALITMTGRFTHPSGAPDNNLLTSYTIGASSTMGGLGGSTSTLEDVIETIGKDAGLWLIPLESGSQRQIDHITDDGQIIVDFPEYHEIFPRAVVSYQQIYGIARPGLNTDGTDTQFVSLNNNLGDDDSRLEMGAPFGLSGASSLYDRETRASNGTPWNVSDGGGYMSGRNYLNLGASGADLAIFENDEVYGIRVILPIPNYPSGIFGGIEKWSGPQRHHMRILGEFPIRKTDTALLDSQGNPDTSFITKLPADTPFLFQSIDKYGMALDIETTSRSVTRGEQQLCIGCHVHTREGMDPFTLVAKLDTDAPYGDFTGDSAPLFSGFDNAGEIIVENANSIYNDVIAPGINNRKSFAVDWNNGVSEIIENRCASCHDEGQSAQQLTGLRLDGSSRTYDLIINNRYTREDGVTINSSTLPGDGLNDVLNNTPGTDRIVKRLQCCTDSRWVSFNSARSSMLIWALYGERLDGRNPDTGLPWGASGEIVPPDKQGLTGVLVDSNGREKPEVWPNVTDHLAFVAGMPEAEKRLLARWIDIGAPNSNVHDDMQRPVLTVTPILDAGMISTVLLGIWDDSVVDYSRFEVKHNDVVIMTGADIVGTPTVIEVILPTPIDELNADFEQYSFEIWDKPDRSLSLVSSGSDAENRQRKVLTGRAMLNLVDINPPVIDLIFTDGFE